MSRDAELASSRWWVKTDSAVASTCSCRPAAMCARYATLHARSVARFDWARRRRLLLVSRSSIDPCHQGVRVRLQAALQDTDPVMKPMRGGTTEEHGELVGQGLCPAANPILDLRHWLRKRAKPAQTVRSPVKEEDILHGLPVMVVVVSGHRPFPAAHGLYTSLPLAWHPLWGEVNWPQPQPTSPPTHVRSKRESSPQIKLPGGKPKEMQKKSSGSCGCSAPITAVPTASWSAPIKKMAIDPSGGGRGEDSKDDTAGLGLREARTQLN
nr:unnamed protein product [Digitaria exilis]